MEPLADWQALASTAWQGGAGLALGLAVACWGKRGEGRVGMRALLGSWLWLVLPIAVLAWTLPQLGRPGAGGVLFLPVALIYVLADSRLGGRLLGSAFALVLWGAGFGVGAWASSASSGRIPIPAGVPEGLWYLLALSVCFVLGAMLARLRRGRFEAGIFHLAWMAASVVSVAWVLRIWM